ncbi:MAG: MBL fold metallo-hydrolase, partial [Ktedonobacteraceae bacterium]|nr:MBL fold metallo-hydrolase [Ktedonobacteraceae bacterium]
MEQPLPEQPRSNDVTVPVVREVVPNLWKILLPIPFPLRTVNVYALAGRDGWALIDTGMGMPEARVTFEEWQRLSGLRIETLRVIVLTHHHPDHVGLSGELHAQSGAPVYMHPIDEAKLQAIWSGSLPRRFEHVSRFFQQHGLPPTKLWYNQTDQETVRRLINVPPHDAFLPLEDGQDFELMGESYRIIWTPGHADGQICLFRKRDGLFLAADHVLPRITPNIGLYSDRERKNPLDDYLNSLNKVANLPVTLVLPGHGEPFTDLAGRVEEIKAHHGERLQQILDLLAREPQNANQLTNKLFQERTLKNDEARRMAVAEILAHLEYLRFQGKVEQRHTKDGTILYAIA